MVGCTLDQMSTLRLHIHEGSLYSIITYRASRSESDSLSGETGRQCSQEHRAPARDLLVWLRIKLSLPESLKYPELQSKHEVSEESHLRQFGKSS